MGLLWTVELAAPVTRWPQWLAISQWNLQGHPGLCSAWSAMELIQIIGKYNIYDLELFFVWNKGWFRIQIRNWLCFITQYRKGLNAHAFCTVFTADQGKGNDLIHMQENAENVRIQKTTFF